VAGEQIDLEADDWLAGANRVLPDVYEETVREADRYSDDLFEKSSAVAKQDQIAVVRQQLDQKRQALEELRAQDRSIRKRWEELWRPCGFAPLEPEAMSGWLENHRSLCALVARISHLAGEARSMADHIASSERRLREGLGREAGDGSGRLVAARQRVDAATKKEQERIGLEKSSARLQSEAREVAEKLSKNRDRQKAGNARKQATLRRLGFPADWDLVLAESVIPRLAKVQVSLRTARQKEGQIAELTERVDGFDKLVRTLCAELGPELLQKPSDVAAAMLRDHLSAHEKRVLLKEKLASSKMKLRDVQRKREVPREQVSALLCAAGAGIPREFLQVAERARRIA
jgi:hypothetical protein